VRVGRVGTNSRGTDKAGVSFSDGSCAVLRCLLECDRTVE
jgi:hypothetical protein